MDSKRRDSKGRLLKDGESQRADGMYMYRYSEAGGARRTVYSWRLVETDKLPPGKKAGTPLRSLEKQLARDADMGVSSFDGGNITVDECFNEYMALKRGLKPTTQATYVQVYNRYIKDSLGQRSVGSIRYSDIKRFYLSLCYDKGLKPSTVNTVHVVNRIIFTQAVRDRYIHTDPTLGVYAELKRQVGWTQEKRRALTEAEQSAFIGFVRDTPRYSGALCLFTVLLGTGCRIGEVAGLRWEDCDFSENLISINHSLAFYKPAGEQKKRFIVSTPKTKAGVREIPMLTDVRNALLDEWTRQLANGFSKCKVDGFTGFIFQTRQGNPYHSGAIDHLINSIVRSYNAKETEDAKRQHRKALLLPHFSVHNLRHTFCTRFCENETNLKVIQEIMGHATIKTTMDIYNEATMDKKKASFANLDGKIKIG